LPAFVPERDEAIVRLTVRLAPAELLPNTTTGTKATKLASADSTPTKVNEFEERVADDEPSSTLSATEKLPPTVTVFTVTVRVDAVFALIAAVGLDFARALVSVQHKVIAFFKPVHEIFGSAFVTSEETHNNDVIIVTHLG
jgi:hypothetical protein